MTGGELYAEDGARGIDRVAKLGCWPELLLRVCCWCEWLLWWEVGFVFCPEVLAWGCWLGWCWWLLSPLLCGEVSAVGRERRSRDLASAAAACTWEANVSEQSEGDQSRWKISPVQYNGSCCLRSGISPSSMLKRSWRQTVKEGADMKQLFPLEINGQTVRGFISDTASCLQKHFHGNRPAQNEASFNFHGLISLSVQLVTCLSSRLPRHVVVCRCIGIGLCVYTFTEGFSDEIFGTLMITVAASAYAATNLLTSCHWHDQSLASTHQITSRLPVLHIAAVHAVRKLVPQDFRFCCGTVLADTIIMRRTGGLILSCSGWDMVQALRAVRRSWCVKQVARSCVHPGVNLGVPEHNSITSETLRAKVDELFMPR